MRFDWTVTRPLRLLNVCLPYDVEVECTRGEQRIEFRNTGAVVTPGSLTLSANRHFHYHLLPDCSGAASATVYILGVVPTQSEMECQDWDEIKLAFTDKYASVSMSLSKKIFRFPLEDWSLEGVAESVGAKRRGLQCRLFQENASFTDILTRSRKLRALFSSLEWNMPPRESVVNLRP